MLNLPLEPVISDEKVLKKNTNTAVSLFKQSEQEVPAAKYNLATCYLWGDGVEKDLKQAIKRYREAAFAGSALTQFRVPVQKIKTL